MSASKVKITAKLLRGRTYVFRNIHFLRGVPLEVTPELADELEALVDTVIDGDGEAFDKAIFDVSRGVEVSDPAAQAGSKGGLRRRPLAANAETAPQNVPHRIRPRA